MKEYDREFLLQMLEGVVQCFGLDELKDLCLRLGVNYEELPEGVGIRGKARALILYMQRRGKLAELALHCAQLCPEYHWPSINGNLLITNPMPSDTTENTSTLSHEINPKPTPRTESRITRKRLLVWTLPIVLGVSINLISDMLINPQSPNISTFIKLL